MTKNEMNEEMMKHTPRTVSVSEYWASWMQKVVDSHVRKSKAEIVEEGLKNIRYGLEREVAEMEQIRAEMKEKHEPSYGADDGNE